MEIPNLKEQDTGKSEAAKLVLQQAKIVCLSIYNVQCTFWKPCKHFLLIIFLPTNICGYLEAVVPGGLSKVAWNYVNVILIFDLIPLKHHENRTLYVH